ncbi:MAG: hypothetical protein LBG16_00575, partial [Elusimicrobiota bacterium]|nr:hypothetical protein [Elusimicrobiota bacterium]
MKAENIAVFGAGIVFAALVWYFYLGPKYDIKRGDAATMQALHEADIKALEEAAAGIDGETVASSYETYPGEETAVPEEAAEVTRDEALAAAAEESFDFYSRAKRPLTMEQRAAAGDKRRQAKIVLDDNEATMSGRITQDMPDGYSAEDIPQDENGEPILQGAKSRFTMLIAPVKYHLVKDAAAYAVFNKVGAYPAVDFKKNMIILLESDGQLANGFFEIEAAEDGAEAIAIDYKVNIIGGNERSATMAHTILPKSDKKIILR